VVQSRELKDGKPVEDMVFDEQRLVVLEVPNILEVAPLTNEPGGERLVPRHAPPPAAY
jgi:hypothetical protein